MRRSSIRDLGFGIYDVRCAMCDLRFAIYDLRVKPGDKIVINRRKLNFYKSE